MYNDNFIDSSKNKNKAVWQVINKVTNKKQVKRSFSVNKLKIGDENAKETLNRVNSYFIDKFDTKLSNNVQAKVFLKQNITSSLYFHDTTEEEILTVINSLKPSKSVGVDGISVVYLKSVKQHILSPLVYLINLCFKTGTFPEHLKKTKIILIHKKGDKKQIDNYRPIAILNVLAKIFEKVIADRLMKFFNRFQVFADCQNGFIGGRSTERAIFQFLEKVYLNLNEKQKTAGLFLDLSKAFDAVSHPILINKLGMLGVRGVANALMESYLKGRLQQIYSVNEKGIEIASDWQSVKHGVPQGSVLGPLLFIAYVNDLPDCMNEHIISYADDTSVVVSGVSTGALKQKCLNSLQMMVDWFDSNQLTLNVDKTQLIQFRSSYKQSEEIAIQLKTKQVGTVDSVKFLGVIVDERLTWKNHVDYIAAKMCTLAYQLRTLRYHASEKTCLTAYKSYVQSVMRYGLIFWGNSVDLPRILILQKRCIRNIFGMKNLESCRPVFKRQKLLTVIGLYILECALFLKKNYTFFSDREPNHEYQTRKAHLLLTDHTRLTQVQKSVKNSIIQIYNHLPDTIKALPYLSFKRTLKSLLVDTTYYSLAEFYEQDCDLQPS